MAAKYATLRLETEIEHLRFMVTREKRKSHQKSDVGGAAPALIEAFTAAADLLQQRLDDLF